MPKTDTARTPQGVRFSRVGVAATAVAATVVCSAGSVACDKMSATSDAGSSTMASTTAPTGGAASQWTEQLRQLGFYAVVDGKAHALDFREYGGGATQRSLPTADFPGMPELRAGDFLVFYGKEESLSDAFAYMEESGAAFRSTGRTTKLDSLFSLEPTVRVNEQPVLKLVPKPNAQSGVYFLHRYVGSAGDAYLGFRIGASREPRKPQSNDEARQNVGAIAKMLSDYMQTRKLDRFPPSARPVPQEVPRGTTYQSTSSDWIGTWLTIGFRLSEPQRYSYEVVTAPTGASATVRARGDLDGDGINSEFDCSMAVANGVVTVAPRFEERNPEE